ncbi:hypothetical protein APHAL10511_003244 [Amanita phalloides]|nr:hypothetical protein APHAL10511_003244 [Amanita phalloides]
MNNSEKKESEKGTRNPVKLLLLGQSGSGKTTVRKIFQSMHNKDDWTEERASWRPVVYLNLVRNVNRICEFLSREISDTSLGNVDGDLSDDSAEDITMGARAESLPSLRFQEKHRLLQQRLQPLLGVQTDLGRLLGAAAAEMHVTNEAFPISNERDVLKSADELVGDSAEPLISCREAITALWQDPIIQDMLNPRNIRLEESPGFFLNDVDRIASCNYQPTDDDVVQARLRTLGVQKSNFFWTHDTGSAPRNNPPNTIAYTAGHECRLYEVGGIRNSLAAWYPFFDDVDAIIFLAPVSPFDERLAEDNRVNCLEDSFRLWRSVCANKLFARTQLILLLNKYDLLQAKLRRGVRIRDSVPSFGDRKNDLPTALRYFQHHFREIATQSSSTTRRNIFIHVTSAIDTKTVATILTAVKECVIHKHLLAAQLI